MPVYVFDRDVKEGRDRERVYKMEEKERNRNRNGKRSNFSAPPSSCCCRQKR